MSAWLKTLIVFLGAGVGGNARYWIGGWIQQSVGTTFPWGTLTINVSGSILIGLISGVLMEVANSDPWRLLLVVGFLGGYTTFSSFSLETMRLIGERSYLYALVNVFGSCLLAFFGTWLGMVAARALTRA